MKRRTPERIQSDLEARGLSTDLARALAQRLGGAACALEPDLYEALVCGVVITAAEQAQLRASRRDLDEAQRLLHDFDAELRKLDEALQTLAAYLLRIRSQTQGQRLLH
jgi:hypothetical protein